MVESMLGSPRPCLLLALSSNPASSVELVPNGSSPPNRGQQLWWARVGMGVVAPRRGGCQFLLFFHRTWPNPMV